MICCTYGTNYASASTVGNACLGKLTHGYGCVVPSAQIPDCQSDIPPYGWRKDGMRADRYAITIAGGLWSEAELPPVNAVRIIVPIGTAHTIARGYEVTPET